MANLLVYPYDQIGFYLKTAQDHPQTVFLDLIPLRGPISNHLRWMLGSFLTCLDLKIEANLRNCLSSREIDMGSPSLISLVVLNNLITVKVAAAYSGYSTQYLRRLLRDGNLAGLKLGQVWLIQMDSFEAYLANAESSKDHRFGPK